MTPTTNTTYNTTTHNTTTHNTTTRSEPHSLAQNSSWAVEECLEVRFSRMEYLPWDNPDNILSAATETYTRRIADILIGCLFLIGGPANVINMAVFYKQGLRDRVNVCLFSLAVADGLYLTAATFLHGESMYLQLRGESAIPPANQFMANNNMIVFMGLCFVSFLLSGIIACERCFCIFHPLKYHTLLRTRTMAFIILAVCVLALGPFFVVAYKYRVGCLHDPETGVVLQAMVAGEFYRSHKRLVDFLDSVVYGAVFPGGTMIVVVTATVMTTVKLRQVLNWRSETSTSLSSRELALTKMLIGSSVFFILCISPSFVFRVVSLLLPEMRVGGRHHNFFNTTLWILSSFSFVNSSFNFFIYYGMGSRYRETVWELICRHGAQASGKGRSVMETMREEAGDMGPGGKVTSCT